MQKRSWLIVPASQRIVKIEKWAWKAIKINKPQKRGLL
jgi:hypothetical protein